MTTEQLPMVVGEAEVRAVTRVAPSFVRVELGGACLDGVGVDGELRDQRFKLVFPAAGRPLPALPADPTWYTAWTAQPEDERGSMRTYTIRDVRGEGEDSRLVVDIVVHDLGKHSGPGNEWASSAAVGDRVLVVAPRRGHDFGGIEFLPASTSRLLVVADETAVPAAYGILRDLPADARGCVLLEVPTSADAEALAGDLVGPDGVDVDWLPRDGAPRGERLRAATLQRLEAHPDLAAAVAVDDDVDPDLWETPAYSSSGEVVADGVAGADVATDGHAGPYAGLYAWIAGESKVVTGLRRHLVKDLGLHRSQVAFMGYWREGVAMKG